MRNRSDRDEPLDAQLRRLYPSLSGAERQLADVLLAQRDAVAAYSATELAQMAQVSKASAARFFRRLGFVDFNAFRTRVRAEVIPQAPLHRLSPPAGRGKRLDLGQRLQAHAAADAACLARLEATLDLTALDAAIDRLIRGKRIWVLGYRNAHTVAFYAQALLHQLRPHVRLLDDGSGRETEWLADIDRDDVVLAIDLRRRTRRLTQLVEVLHDQGVPVVLLTDVQASALDAHAAAVLRTPSHFAQIFDAYVAPMSLINFLACEVAARANASTHKRLSQIEALHTRLDDLDPDTATNARTVT